MIGQIVVPYIIETYQLHTYVDCYVDADKRKEGKKVAVGAFEYEIEVFVNCGSNIGDTIFWYLAKNYSFDEIHAYEGDGEIFKKLEKNISLLDKDMQKKIILHKEYIGRKKDEVDTQFKGKRITLINADIEGAELGVLKGMRNIIEQHKPVIAFCVYHKVDDFLTIPRFILELNCGYHIYFRKYVHYDRNRWEVVMYAVPNERRMK